MKKLMMTMVLLPLMALADAEVETGESTEDYEAQQVEWVESLQSHEDPTQVWVGKERVRLDEVNFPYVYECGAVLRKTKGGYRLDLPGIRVSDGCIQADGDLAILVTGENLVHINGESGDFNVERSIFSPEIGVYAHNLLVFGFGTLTVDNELDNTVFSTIGIVAGDEFLPGGSDLTIGAGTTVSLQGVGTGIACDALELVLARIRLAGITGVGIDAESVQMVDSCVVGTSSGTGVRSGFTHVLQSLVDLQCGGDCFHSSDETEVFESYVTLLSWNGFGVNSIGNVVMDQSSFSAYSGECGVMSSSGSVKIGEGRYTIATGDGGIGFGGKCIVLDGGDVEVCSPNGAGFYLRAFSGSAVSNLVHSGSLKMCNRIDIRELLTINLESAALYGVGSALLSTDFPTFLNDVGGKLLMNGVEALVASFCHGGAKFGIYFYMGARIQVMEIDGGTILADCAETGIEGGNLTQVVINGGSFKGSLGVYAKPIASWKEGETVVLKDLKCVEECFPGGKEGDKIVSGWKTRLPSYYGTRSLYLDDELKLYFWIPEGSHGAESAIVELLKGNAVDLELGRKLIGYTAQNLPKGLTFVGATGKVTGKATVVTGAAGVEVVFKKTGATDVKMTFIVRDEKMSIGCTWLSGGTFTAGVSAGAGNGILLDDYVTTESGVKSIAVANLPAGMSYDARNRTIAGFPNKAGTYNVEITVTAQSGAVEKQTISLTVEALPAWAVGNFEGTVICADGTHGTASLSVTAAGAVSGKFLEHGSSWTLTASSYDAKSVTRGEKQVYVINAEAKCGTAKRMVSFTVTGQTVEGLTANAGLATGDLGGGTMVEMWRNVWAETEPKAHLSSIAGKYTYFLTDGERESVALPLSLNESSALLTGAAKIPWQANRSVTFSATVFASPNGVEAAFYVAPDAAKGYPEFFERFTLVPESGEREIGKAHRNPGVIARAIQHEKGGNGSVSVSPAGGQVDAGQSVTLTATAKSDSVFVRWEGSQGSRQFVEPNAKLVVTMDGELDVVAEAVFRLKESFDEPEIVMDSAAEYALGRISVGVPVSIRPGVKNEEDMLPVKWSAQNLPTGLKIDATTGEITGVATAINSKPIVIIATSVADSKKVGKIELAANVKPAALPAWAVGTFEGTVRCADGTHGTASFTVSAAGAISSGKIVEHGQSWTFTAKSFATTSVTRGLEQDYVILSDAKCGTVTRQVELHVMGCAVEGVAESAAFAAGFFGDSELELWRNVWKDTDAKGVVAGIAGKYTYFFAGGTPLPLNLTSAGALSGSAKIPVRGNASVTFSTTVFASSNGVEAAFYVAPDARKGYEEIYERFTLVPESGEMELGKAHRAPGVVTVPESYVSPGGTADTGMGTATVSPAGGQVDAGKTVTVSATPDSKSVFVKWRYAIDGETNFCETAKMAFTMDGEHDVKAWAIFRSKESFAEPVVAVEDSEQAKFAALELGVQFSAFVTVTDVENMKPVKWSATNLPTGLRINAETGEISGVATAVNSKPVVITATSVANSQKKTTFTLDIGAQDGKPAALPETAVGTFTGFVDNGTDNVGTFTFTSSDKGALSAKVIDAKGTVSFSGSGFAKSKDRSYGVELKTTKGETLSLTLDSGAGWDKDQLTGTYKAANGQELGVTAQRNAFSKAWYFAAEGDETAGWTFAFTADTKAVALTVTLKADGTTSVAGKLPNGVDKNGRAVILSVSASGVANVGMMNKGAMAADFAPVLTVGGKKKALAIRTNLWFDRKNDHESGVGEAKFVE